MYYNTNNETGLTLSDSWVKSAQQNELILRLFMDNVNQAFKGDLSEAFGGSSILKGPTGEETDFSEYSNRLKQDLAEIFYKNSEIELSESQKKALKRSTKLKIGETTVDISAAVAEMILIHKGLGSLGWLGYTEKLRKAPNYISKVSGFLLGMGTEAVVMEHVFDTDEYVTGSAFYAFGKMIPGGQIFKLKGEFARLNKALDSFARHGVQGTAAMEFTHNVEAIAHDIAGGEEYKNWAKERYLERPVSEQAEEACICPYETNKLMLKEATVVIVPSVT